jgi:hypothetical protein
VLAVVNERLPSSQQLTGLSRAAISKWRAVIGIERTRSINPILESVAEQCQRLSDRSNETFSALEAAESQGIERYLVDLDREFKKCL